MNETEQEQPVATQPSTPDPRDDRVGRQVIQTLGQPSDLYRVQVRRLWENRYRVNVLTTYDGLSAKIANSYFLVTDGEGVIVTASPTLAREY